MKKIIILITAALICASLLIPVSASRDWVEPVGDVYAPFVTTPPTLDGVMSEGEWCETATFIINDWNMMAVYTNGFMEVTEGWQGEVNIAWDYDYLYVFTHCNDSTTTGRPLGGTQEGDYFRFNLDFGDAPDAMFSGVSAAWCLVEDTETNDLTSHILYLVNAEPNGDWKEGSWAVSIDEGKKGWSFEGRIPWSIISSVYEFNSGVSVTPQVGMEATCMIWYCDFDENYIYTNWFGTSLTGYDQQPWFGPSGFGINISFVGSESDVKPRPETTEPGQTEPPVVSEEPASSAEDTQNPPASSAENNNPDTSAPTTQKAGENDKNGGLPTGAIIGIAAGAAVVIAGGAAIIFSKKKKA